MNDFGEDLAFSNSCADLPFWEPVYRAAFPTMAAMHSVRQDGWAQRGGIDRVIQLRDGKSYTADEKARRQDYGGHAQGRGDIALEIYSDERRKTPGWLLRESACDFIAYAVVPAQICYLFPFPLLKRAYQLNKHRWAADPERYPQKRACNDWANPPYVTLNLIVPLLELLDAIRDATIIRWQQRPSGLVAPITAEIAEPAFAHDVAQEYENWPVTYAPDDDGRPFD